MVGEVDPVVPHVSDVEVAGLDVASDPLHHVLPLRLTPELGKGVRGELADHERIKHLGSDMDTHVYPLASPPFVVHVPEMEVHVRSDIGRESLTVDVQLDARPVGISVDDDLFARPGTQLGVRGVDEADARAELQHVHGGQVRQKLVNLVEVRHRLAGHLEDVVEGVPPVEQLGVCGYPGRQLDVERHVVEL